MQFSCKTFFLVIVVLFHLLVQALTSCAVCIHVAYHTFMIAVDVSSVKWLSQPSVLTTFDVGCFYTKYVF